jgi:hypothetical protein
MKHSKFFLSSIAIIVGFGGIAATALAQSGDSVVALCYRDRTIRVPNYLVTRYTAKGATPNACPATTVGRVAAKAKR